ncbi:MAG: transposase [Elusimicrobia bacterium]|nr:transposase [Elusimicrobiota bacterium]
MARGVDGRAIFNDERDRRDFLRIILALQSETHFSILAYCLMGNHFHFALRVGSTPLSRIIQRLLTQYVLGFNQRHEREGHLFQARYKAALCLDDVYLITLIRYIHMNPVRAGLTKTPDDWPWSSYQHYVGRTSIPITNTRLFFEALNIEGASAEEFARWPTVGDESFNPWPSDRTFPLLREEEAGVEPIDALASSLFPEDLAALKSGSRLRAITAKKRRLADQALRNGHSLVSIAAWMKCSPSAIHHLLRRNKSNK